MEEINGEVNHPAPKNIYDILGYKNSPFKTDSREEYEAYLNTMASSDLRDECRLHNIPYHTRPEITKRKLLENFLKETSNYKIPSPITEVKCKDREATQKMLDRLYNGGV